MDLTSIVKSRYGQSHDPNWQKYHQWPWSCFPIGLPSCSIHMHQQVDGPLDFATIHWEIERGIEIVARLARPDGSLLAEILPEAREGNHPRTGDHEYFHRIFQFTDADLRGLIGFGFDWVFQIPVPPVGSLQPSHSLGVVRVEGSELLGKATTISIQAGGRERPRF
jgi:hypothetical protein